jgi:hypothetical protein
MQRTSSRPCLHMMAFTLLALVLLPGCAAYSGGRIQGVSLSPDSPPQPPAVGKTLLVISGSDRARMFDSPPPTDELTHLQRIWYTTLTVLKSCPGATIINEEDPPALWWEDLGDQAAIDLARQRGADTVCLLSVGDFEGRIVVLPPVWSTTTRVTYSLRVLDANTRQLTLHSVSSADRDGLFIIAGPGDLESDLRKMLRWDLALRNP